MVYTFTIAIDIDDRDRYVVHDIVYGMVYVIVYGKDSVIGDGDISHFKD